MSLLQAVSTVLVLLGLTSMTIATIGALRLTDLYLRLHAAAKSVVFGVVALLAASMGTGDMSLIARAALVAIFVLLTAPVSAHVIARARYAQLRTGDEKPGD